MKKSYEMDMCNGPILSKVLVYAFPLMLSGILQLLFNAADVIVVGRYAGSQSLAAVGSTSALINLLVNVFIGLSVGVNVLVAQYYGAKKEKDLKETIHTSMLLSVLSGILLTIIGILSAKQILIWMQAPEEVLKLAVVYLRIYFLGMTSTMIYNFGSAILRAVGDSKRPLYFLIAACICNIVLDILFVLVLHMGVTGVALATILSQLVAAILVVRVLLKTELPIRVFPKEITIVKEHLKSVLRVGIPSGLQSNMYTISNIALQACINSFGTNSVAAWTAYGKVDSFFWMIIGAFGISITTFVGQNYGAGQYERVRKAVKTCLIMTFSASIAIGTFFCLFAQPLLGIFTADADVLAIGMRILYMTAPTYVTFVCIEILSGTIRGCGNSLPPMLLTCCGVCVFRVAWVLILQPLWNSLDMVIVSYPVSWTLTSILFIIYYRKFNWMRR